MGIRFQCDACGKSLHVKEFLAGKRAICPKCRASIEIPLESTYASGSVRVTWKEQEKQLADSAAAESNAAATLDMESSKQSSNPEVAAVASEATKSTKKGRRPHSDAAAPEGGEKVAEPNPKKSVSKKKARKVAAKAGDYTANKEAKSSSKGDEAPPPVPATQGVSDDQISAVRSATADSEPFSGLGNDDSKETASGDSSPGRMGPPVPGAVDPIDENPDAIWYVRPPSGGQYGPAAGDLLRRWIDEGRVSASSLIWREGWDDWLIAGQVFPSLVPSPPGTSQPQPEVAVEAMPGSPTAESSVAPVDQSASKVLAYRRRRARNSLWTVAAIVFLSLLVIGLAIVLFVIVMN